MRLWTAHPRYLDTKGLVALWREGLLAKAVLEGKTKGYINHSQLIRFREQDQPLAALIEYLHSILDESRSRKFNFDKSKLPIRSIDVSLMEESEGQLKYEWQHLLNKLELRDHVRFARLSSIESPESHPLFRIVPGGMKSWEVTRKG